MTFYIYKNSNYIKMGEFYFVQIMPISIALIFSPFGSKKKKKKKSEVYTCALSKASIFPKS